MAKNLSQQKTPALQLSRMSLKVIHPFFYNNLSLFVVSAAANPQPGLGHTRGEAQAAYHVLELGCMQQESRK